MSETVTVAQVSSNEPRTWVHADSGNVVYYYKVKFAEYPDRVVEWGVKNKPEVGQTVEGDFKNDPKWGWGFKRAKKEGGYGGGKNSGDFRTREQVIMQHADGAAATLVLAAAQAGVPIDAVLKDFYKASAALQERVSGAGTPYGDGADKAANVRKDILHTDESDVPDDGFDPSPAQHPSPAQQQMGSEPDDIPFLWEPTPEYPTLKSTTRN